MKIRISICTEDSTYAERLTCYFNAHYYDRFSWNTYTGIDYLMRLFHAAETDILLLGEELKDRINVRFFDELGDCQPVYLTDRLVGELPDTVYEIEKYCRADKMYQNLLEIYSRKRDVRYTNAQSEESGTGLYAFISPCGGMGTSSAAMAAAKRFARTERVLYVSFENMGGTSLVFGGEESRGFEEIIFALKSRRKALDLKIESTVSRDKSGVFYFGDCHNALELSELNAQDVGDFLSAVRNSGKYDKVLIDIGNSLEEKDMEVLLSAERLIVVMDNSEIAKIKWKHYLDTLHMIERLKQTDICSKLMIFMNRIRKGVSLPDQIIQVRVGGNLPLLENGTYSGIVEKLAEVESFQNIR